MLGLRPGVALAIALALSACSPTQSPAPTSPDLTTPVPTVSSEAIEAARQFRESFGLRADTAWILAVAARPDVDRDTFGVPLTIEELGELNQRARNAEAIKEIVTDYGSAHAGDWAGVFIDHQQGGALVVQFARSLEAHRATLLTRIWPGAEIEFRLVRNSLTQLDAISAVIRLDDPWLATIPAVATGVGPNVPANRVELQVSSANPSADTLIWEHYGLGPDQLLIVSDGNGALLLALGQLRVVAVDASRAPVSDLGCAAYPDADGAYEPHPVPMPTTDDTGTCLLTLPATGYWVRLEDGDSSNIVAIGRAVVVADQISEVTVVVP
ncbi:MAG: hypothetical protein AB1736_04045 [Chloroflexota bacterium]